jgi:diguanylate cyclase (GGDEF)-like protein
MFYALLIILVNLSLGFVGAAYLGHRWRMLQPGGSLPRSQPFLSPVLSILQTRELHRSPPTDAEVMSDEVSRMLSGPPDMDQADADPQDDVPQEESPPAQADERKPSELELALEAIQEGCRQYDLRLTDLEKAIRSLEASPDEAAIRAIVESIQEANGSYSESLTSAHDKIHAILEPEVELASASSILREAVETQSRHIQQISTALKQADYHGHPAESYQQAIVELGRLFGANHRMRDTLDATACVAAQFEQREQKRLETSADSPDGLPNRASVEAQLLAWRERALHFCMAVIDIDQFGKINEQHGTVLGSRILKAAYRVAAKGLPPNGMMGRLGGQRFALLLPDGGLRQATSSAEQIRQQMETTVLSDKEETFRLTVSCGITASQPQDTGPAAIERAEEALLEAKRAGRNRSFTHDGKSPTPVVPPNLTVQELTEAI